MDHSTNPTTRPARPLLIWAALLTLYVVWGSTYLGILFAIETMPPYVMGAIRFAIAGGLMLVWSIARNPGSWPSLREVRDSSIVGALLLGGGMGLVAWGEQTIPSSIAALLIALLPAWLVILGRVFVGERVSRTVGIGIAIGLVGVAILAGPWETTGGLDPIGVAALLGSPILWATGSVFSAHRAVEPSDPVRAIAIQMLAGGAVLAILSVPTGDLARFDVAAVSRDSMIALAYLALIGSVVGFSCYIWLLRHAPLARIGTYAYVNPVVAIILGAVLAGEAVTMRTGVAAAVIIFAVALIVTARGRSQAEQAAVASATRPGKRDAGGEQDRAPAPG